MKNVFRLALLAVMVSGVVEAREGGENGASEDDISFTVGRYVPPVCSLDRTVENTELNMVFKDEDSGKIDVNKIPRFTVKSNAEKVKGSIKSTRLNWEESIANLDPKTVEILLIDVKNIRVVPFSGEEGSFNKDGVLAKCPDGLEGTCFTSGSEYAFVVPSLKTSDEIDAGQWGRHFATFKLELDCNNP